MTIAGSSFITIRVSYLSKPVDSIQTTPYLLKLTGDTRRTKSTLNNVTTETIYSRTGFCSLFLRQLLHLTATIRAQRTSDSRLAASADEEVNRSILLCIHRRSDKLEVRPCAEVSQWHLARRSCSRYDRFEQLAEEVLIQAGHYPW